VKGLGAGVKVGITALLVGALAWFAFKFVSKGIGRDEGYEVWALFRDAGGLVDKSRVQVAGLTIGEIKGRRLQGTLARVTIKVRPDVELWSNAVIYKRTASLLGEFYLEIDPGTAESPDPLTRKPVPNYRMKGCLDETHVEDCNRIKNVVEAVTAGDVLVQLSETIPVLRDILKDVQKVTQGPLQDIAKGVQEGVERNSQAAERLLNHIDEIAADVKHVTGGPASADLQKSMENIRQITEQVKKLVGAGEGQVNSTADKIKEQLDKLSVTLDKFNTSLDNVSEVTGNVAKGRGTVGRLLKDETIADNLTDITEDASAFIRSLTKLQTIVGIREEFHVGFGGWDDRNYKTYLSLRLQPRPDKYYLIELIDDPHGSKSYSHTLTATGDPANPTLTNTDTWTRTNSFRFSFMFAKRIQIARAAALTGRIGIKESTGGVGGDLEVGLRDGFWLRAFTLSIDVFDFLAEKYPRLKVMAALELFKHVWLIGGLDDLLNGATTEAPAGITCGPATPQSWCRGGRDVFFGLQLTFNDDDLKSLLAVGVGALAGAATR
jgi:phospholipid/cholesterol/gamma-HCH transport system substrate-binding protein